MDINLLILLHGAGDDHRPFHMFAKRMELPQTASLSLHASSMGPPDATAGTAGSGGFVTLPFGLGSTWFQEMDYSTDGRVLDLDDHRRVQSLKRAVDKLNRLIEMLSSSSTTGTGRCLWPPERIFLFGYSAGACLAMETCQRRVELGLRALGGAVCVAGGLRRNGGLPCLDKSGDRDGGVTPVLVIGGSEDERFPPSAVHEAVRLYNADVSANGTLGPMEGLDERTGAIAYVKEGKGHEMVRSPEEMEVVMKFFAKRLVRWMVGMEGWTEVTTT